MSIRIKDMSGREFATWYERMGYTSPSGAADDLDLSYTTVYQMLHCKKAVSPATSNKCKALALRKSIH